MTVDEFLKAIDGKLPPASEADLAAFEKDIGARLPDDYRQFLIDCNGGFLNNDLWFQGPTPEGKPADAGVVDIGGLRDDTFSLASMQRPYQGSNPGSPKALIWIMGDVFGNSICLGVDEPHRGHVFFYDHENEPDPSTWDGRAETAENIQLLAKSFTEFVHGLSSL